MAYTNTKRTFTLSPSTSLAFFFSIVVIPFVVFPQSDRQAWWNMTRVFMRSAQSHYRSSSFLPPRASAQKKEQHTLSSSTPTTQEPRRRPMSQLEQKFYISIPTISWQNSSIFLDYHTSEWVSLDVIRYQLLEWNCPSEHLQVSEEENVDNIVPLFWNARPPEKVSSTDSTSAKTEDSMDFATQIWRLTLDWDDESASSVAAGELSQPYSFCVRWMVHNLPTSHEYSMEVTFQRTQLSVHYSQQQQHQEETSSSKKITSIQIEQIDVSIPETPTIGVNVNGRGRAVVHGEL